MTNTVNGVTISQEAVRVEALHHAAAEDPEAGLVWSGGYGAQRKVAGTEQVLRSLSETLGMGLMGAGGLIAVIGGLICSP